MFFIVDDNLWIMAINEWMRSRSIRILQFAIGLLNLAGLLAGMYMLSDPVSCESQLVIWDEIVNGSSNIAPLQATDFLNLSRKGQSTKNRDKNVSK